VTLGQIAGDRGDAALAALWFAKAVTQAEGDADREAINRIRVRNWAAAGILTPIAALDMPEHAHRLEFHPGGRHLAGQTHTGDYSVWDVGASTLWRGPPGFEKPTAVAWDRAGSRVVLGGQDRAGVFAFPSGETIRTWDWPGPVTAAAFSPDGTMLALGGTAVQVWDLKAARPASPRWTLPRPLHAIAFTPNGSRVVTVGTDAVMRVYRVAADRSEPEFSTPNQPHGPPQFLVWDRKTGQMLAVFGHENEVVAAELVGGDRFVVSVGHDEVARIWDAATGRPIAPPIKLGGLGLSLDVSPDGRWAVMGGFTPRLTVLDLEAITRPAEGTAEQLLRWVELMAGRRIDGHGGVVNLTANEWRDRWEEYRRSLPASK
jgi:WD40 repeat protein